MSMWTSLALLATLLVSGLSFPHPDESEYKIPDVGTGQRSQYYVLHSDGTFKYGFDDGDGGFESVKSHTVGNREGKFGYVDPDGNTVRLEYEAGKGGFVARGDHLPKPSPEHIKAFSDFVKSSEPFHDPLAASNRHSKPSIEHVKPLSDSQTKTKSSHEPWNTGDTDASYGFEFASDDHSRNEQSDSNGTVTGSYSYVDDNGITRSYNYRAGKGIGFVIEGDGLTQDTPTVSSKTPHSSIRGFEKKVQSPSILPQTDGPEFQAAGDHLPRAYDYHIPSRGSAGIAGDRKHSTTTSSAANQISSTQRGGRNGYKFDSSQSRVSKRPLNVPFEEARIQSSFIPQGSYSFSYDTSSHSRSEKGDEENNVEGDFAFVAHDDGKRRQIKYEAGSDTGFIAEGEHIPIGPVVPGSPSGQPTGRIVPVSSIPFEDPLASSDSDATYNFDFESDTYSRSETADKDGNVVGSYTVVDDDGTRRTYNFRAGEGIGFETEEVSRTQGAPPTTPTSYTGPLAHAHTTGLQSTTATLSSHATPSASRSSAPTHNEVRPTYLPPSRQFQQPQSPQVHSQPQPQPHARLQSPSQPQHQTRFHSKDFEDFTLNTYAVTPNAEKFGYVLRFN